MASPNNSLCAPGSSYCAPLGKCQSITASCPQLGYLPNVTESDCVEKAKLSCLAMSDSFQTAACLRGIQGAFQPAEAMTQEQLSDMIYFPDAVLIGRRQGRGCLSGPTTTSA